MTTNIDSPGSQQAPQVYLCALLHRKRSTLSRLPRVTGHPCHCEQIGGAHGVLVTAVSTIAFKQAIGMLRRGGTCVLNGLPAGEFPVSIFDVVLNGYTVRGSIVGTRLDLEEAFSFAAEGKVKATIETLPLDSINEVFGRMKKGKINGRVVLGIGQWAGREPLAIIRGVKV